MREIVYLPELSPVPEAPPGVVGLVNVRGLLAPIVDPEVLFGHRPHRRRLEDSIVLLERDGAVVGVLVHEVRTVDAFAPDEVEPPPGFARPGLITGLARDAEQVITLLDAGALLRCRDGGPLPALPEGEATPARVADVLPELTEAERLVLRERARALARRIEERDTGGLLPLAVVRLAGELFGIPLPMVREFALQGSVVPVPCCPPHILGQMNLRGEILTLVDVRPALSLAASGADGSPHVVVAQTPTLRVGVPVDSVLDVVYLRADEMSPVPAAGRSAAEEFMNGAAPYGDGMLGVLDLARLLDSGHLVVEEEP